VVGTRARLAVAVLGFVGSGVAAAATSGAAVGPECAGVTQAAVCVTVDPSALPTVNPTGGAPIQECVFAGPPPCTEVDVPTPSVTPGAGSLVTLQCIGALSPCPDPGQTVTSTLDTAEQTAASTLATVEQTATSTLDTVGQTATSTLATVEQTATSTLDTVGQTATSTLGTAEQIVNSALGSGALQITGTGTVSPGLLPTGTNPQTWDFSGTGVVATPTAKGVVNCSVTGDDSIGTWTQGAGSFNGSCSVQGESANVSGSYTRNGAVVTMTGGASGVFNGAFSGSCAFSPIGFSTAPASITAITLVCEFNLSSN